MKNYDVAVVGAGVVGASIARQLSRYKIKIALIDKEPDVSFGTSKANSGIIHAGFHSPPGLARTVLCLKGNRMFDRLKEDLGFSFERRGELVVAFDDAELEMIRFLYAQGLANGVQYLEFLGRERILEMEPNLNPDVLAALYAPTAGIIEPYEYCFALVENAVDNGVDLCLGEKVEMIRKQAFGGFIVETNRGTKLKTQFLVNAAGLYADDIAALLGMRDFTITPRKGEEYLLDRRVGNLVRRVIFPVPSRVSKGMLIIPTVDGTVMVGPTAEDVVSKTDFSTSRDGLDRVFENAKRLVPSIRLADVITSFAGLRPIATGDDFIISPSRIPGFINAAGIQSPGLTSSPAIAEHIEGILQVEGLKLVVKRGFNPVRKPFLKFRHLLEKHDYQSIAELTDKNPGYKKLVCRCENITKAEIVEAIRRGHTTLDGIKFSTRAGMGRCQGGFCTYRIMKIVAEVTGLRYEEISKKGEGSEIVKLALTKGLDNGERD